jgi:hypothetical protein
VLVNNFTYVEGVTPESMDKLIDKLRTEPGKTMSDGPEPHLPDTHGHKDGGHS